MRSGLALLTAFALLSASLGAQGDDPVFVLAGTGYGGATSGAVLRFDRSLVLQVALPNHYGSLASPYGTVYGVCTDSQRRLWVPLPSSPPQILRVDATGRIIDSVTTPEAASSLVAGQKGDVFGLVGSWSGALALDAGGGVLWTKSFDDSFYYDTLKPCLTASGQLWFGGVQNCGFFGEFPVLGRVDTVDGDPLDITPFPGFAQCQPGYLGQLTAALDGSMWAWTTGSAATGYKPALVKTDGVGVLQSIIHESKQYGKLQFPYLRIDGLGLLLSSVYSDCYCVDYCVCWGSQIRRYEPQSGSATVVHELDGIAHGFTLGPTGEDVFAVTSEDWGTSPSPTRLVRVNLVTSARSTVPMPIEWPYFAIPHGDPTGFVFANTVDRLSDTDGDGATNGDETAAGSNPFDPDSRPDGPKVYVSFAPGTNAIEMTLFDPDGLRHPTKGIDFGTMSVTVGGSGNMFWPLLGLVTEASLSADGKTAYAVFGGLPLASDLKLRVEMSVRDRTGAFGWDWQATPPGDL